jgi:hypothetical protein
MRVAPVEMAMSYMELRLLSPKPGAFTKQILSPPLNLLITSAAKGSLSMSSATMSRGFCVWLACSRNLRISYNEEIFFSTSRIMGLSYSTFADLAFVTKYGEMYPLSHLRPSTYSTSVASVFPSCTVIVAC